MNPEGGLNDPNGLCFWKGRWHLFYQAYPPEDTRQHWGHAVSDDLVHWRDLPYAIYPNPEEKCYSGATLVEDDRVIAMYHGTQVGNMVAVSRDPLLLNWEKLTGKAVIPNKSADGAPLPYSVFDPCVWRKDGMYYALSGGTQPNGPGGKRLAADFLFRSKDLAKWEYLHPFVENDRFTLIGDDLTPAEVAGQQHYGQPYRPQFHYTPIQGHIGDATGLIYYRGEYHLFYMFDRWGQAKRDRHKCWGHAISLDLLHWNQRPQVLDAIIDNKPGSGSGAVDWNNSSGLRTGPYKTLLGSAGIDLVRRLCETGIGRVANGSCGQVNERRAERAGPTLLL